jgi:hypothetical protein
MEVVEAGSVRTGVDLRGGSDAAPPRGKRTTPHLQNLRLLDTARHAGQIFFNKGLAITSIEIVATIRVTIRAGV